MQSHEWNPRSTAQAEGAGADCRPVILIGSKVFDVWVHGVPDPKAFVRRLLDVLGPGREGGHIVVTFAQALSGHVVHFWIEFGRFGADGNPSNIRRQLAKVADGIIAESQLHIRLLARDSA